MCKLPGCNTHGSKSLRIMKQLEKSLEGGRMAEKIILNDAPLIPLQLRRKAILTNPSLKNLSTPLIGAQYDFVYASLKP